MNSLTDTSEPRLNERVSNVLSLLADQIGGAAKSADGFVRSSPWQAVGAVALAGLAAGLLVARGSRRARRPLNDAADSISEVSGG